MAVCCRISTKGKRNLQANHYLLTFSLCNKKHKRRFLKKQQTHTGELRHRLSWRKHPLKCWNYVLIFLLFFAPMPLGNCLFAAAAAATAQVNRRGVSLCLCVSGLLCRLLHQEDTADFCWRHVFPPSPAGTPRGRTARINFQWRKHRSRRSSTRQRSSSLRGCNTVSLE